jgi:hypothetical protein
MSLEGFPQTILQSSVKLTSEPPKGVKTSMLRTYGNMINAKKEAEFYNENSKPHLW